MKYKYLFGPVPSRRLGMSLGIDLIPKKICSLDCVYCEVGATTKLTTKRMEYVLYDKVIAEIDDFMTNFPMPDFITFSGSGEPSLNSRFGDVINYIKDNYSSVKVAVLTNGTLMNDADVRNEMMRADLVMPSLDAASTKDFEKINIPAKGIIIEDYISGIETFSKEYKGVLNLEILFLKNYNTNKNQLKKLKSAILRIQPNMVQLNTLDRPGVLEDLIPLSYEELREIADYWALPNVEIIAKSTSSKEKISFGGDKESALIETIKRRPCTMDDLCEILGLEKIDVNIYLSKLITEGNIEIKSEQRGDFYKFTKK